jgi:hypothetical protein
MTIVQVKLDSLSITENGELLKKTPATLVASLFYPRSGAPLVAAAKSLPDLSDGTAINFLGNNPQTNAPYTWADRVLLKEEVIGSTFLVLHVKIGKGKLEKFLEGLAKGLFGAAVGTLASPYATAAGDAVLKALLDSDDKDDSQSIAHGTLLIDSAALPTTPVTLSLKAPSTIVRKGVFTDGPVTVVKEVTVLQKDQVNGSITVSIAAV